MGKAGTLSKRSVRHVQTDGALTWPARPPQADRTPPANADGGAWCRLQLCPTGDTDHVTATAQDPGLKPLPLRLTHDTECGRAHAPRGQEASAQCARCTGGCTSRARGASLGGRTCTRRRGGRGRRRGGRGWRRGPKPPLELRRWHVSLIQRANAMTNHQKSWSDTFDLDGNSGHPQLSGGTVHPSGTETKPQKAKEPKGLWFRVRWAVSAKVAGRRARRGVGTGWPSTVCDACPTDGGLRQLEEVVA